TLPRPRPGRVQFPGLSRDLPLDPGVVEPSLPRRHRVRRRLHAGPGVGGERNIGLAQRLQHNSDGTYVIRSDQAEYEELNSDMGNRRHLLKANFLWDLPDLHSSSDAVKVVGLLVNDWQLSGIFTGGSGARYDISYSYQNGGSSVNLTGS